MHSPRTRIVVALAAISVILLPACSTETGSEAGLDFGTPVTLPPEVVPDQNFERGSDGLALDLEAAEVRFETCMKDAGLEGMETMSPNSPPEKVVTRQLCSEAAGNGWAPGNRPDEVAALNRQAINTTKCVREAGFDFADPVPEPNGRFLRIDDSSIREMVPTDAAEARRFTDTIEECFNRYAIDWEEWVEANPRTDMGY